MFDEEFSEWWSVFAKKLDVFEKDFAKQIAYAAWMKARSIPNSGVTNAITKPFALGRET